MILNDNHLRDLTALATETARAAGSIIDRYRSRDVEMQTKGLGGSLISDVVTEVDLEVQAYIEAALNPSCEQYEIAFLGEESHDDGRRFESDHFWAVDPIDGTLAFCEKREGYSVSIGLIRADGTPIMGVVYDPYNDQLYHATRFSEHKAEAALINGHSIQPSDFANTEKRNDALNCFLDPNYSDDPAYAALLPKIEQFAKSQGYAKGLRIIAKGGAALNASWILANPDALYFKLPKARGGSIWDYAATSAMFSVLGLPACDIHGHPFELNRKESTYMNHKGILFASDQTLADFVIKISDDYIRSTPSRF